MTLVGFEPTTSDNASAVFYPLNYRVTPEGYELKFQGNAPILGAVDNFAVKVVLRQCG